MNVLNPNDVYVFFHDRESVAICLARCFHCLNFQRDQRMAHKANLVIIGISVGLALGILIALLVFYAIRWYKKHAHLRRCTNERSVTTVPIRTNGFGTSTDFSASLSNPVAVKGSESGRKNSQFFLWNNQKKDRLASISGIPKYSYKYVIFALLNFLMKVTVQYQCTHCKTHYYCYVSK